MAIEACIQANQGIVYTNADVELINECSREIVEAEIKEGIKLAKEGIERY